MSEERERADRLGRLLAVQERRRRLAEWRVADLRREGEALQAASAEILESLGVHSLLNGLFLEGRASALRRNEARIVANREAQDQARRALLDLRGAEKRTARAAGEALAAAARRDERDLLADALDDHLAMRAASASLE